MPETTMTSFPYLTWYNKPVLQFLSQILQQASGDSDMHLLNCSVKDGHEKTFHGI